MMKRVIMAGCVLMQLIISVAGADEMPARVNPGRNYRTLEGMSGPVSAPVVGSLQGCIQTSEGTPLAGGEVFFFNDATGPAPAPEKYWRVADELASLDANGGFSVELPPGRYTIGAIKRKGDKTMIGPPSDGDVFYAGKIKYEVLPASLINAEILKGAKPFSMNTIAKGEGDTAIEGSVFDKDGKPVENTIVFAHNLSTMNEKPLFVSGRTDKGGAFRLRVADSGTYYLRVRDIYGGGTPVEGAIMGAYGGKDPKGVIVKKGEVIKGINLVGETFHRTTPKSGDHKKNLR